VCSSGTARFCYSLFAVHFWFQWRGQIFFTAWVPGFVGSVRAVCLLSCSFFLCVSCEHCKILIGSVHRFQLSDCVWIVAGTHPGYILESPDQKTRGFMV
jgi:hypothetical protein